MTNKLVININSLKEPKIKKTLLYEMKFLVPNYNCPWLGGYRPQTPVLPVLCPQLNLLNHPKQNSWVRRWPLQLILVTVVRQTFNLRKYLQKQEILCKAFVADCIDWRIFKYRCFGCGFVGVGVEWPFTRNCFVLRLRESRAVRRSSLQMW